MEFTEFTIEGDPQVYKLAFDVNEICEAEMATGCNLLRPLGGLRYATAVDLRALTYAMLKPAHPLVLLKEAGDLLSRDIATVTAAITEALGVDGDRDAPAVAGEPAAVPAQDAH